MTTPISRIALFALCLSVPVTRAEDTILSAAIPLQKARKSEPRGGGPLDKVEISIFLPDGVKTVRGAIVNPFYVKAVEQKNWQESARLWGFAVLGANYFGVNSSEFEATLQSALKEFAAKSKRPELVHIPFCFVGMSAGAGMSRTFARQMPTRTLAVAPVCLEAAPDDKVLHPIPFLTVFGEKDGGQMKLITARLPERRKEGANWGIAVQWGRGHEFALANNLVLPFFDDVIRLRYLADKDPASGPVPLADIPASAVYLGEIAPWQEKKHTGTNRPRLRVQGRRRRDELVPDGAHGDDLARLRHRLPRRETRVPRRPGRRTGVSDARAE